MKKDAIGNDVIIGKSYGYSVDRSGITAATIGMAVKETGRGITIKIASRRTGIYNNDAQPDHIERARVTVKAMKLFPVNSNLKQ